LHLRALARGLSLFWVLWLTAPVLAQESAAPAELPFGFRLTEWNQALTEVGGAAESGDLTLAQAEALRARLVEVRRAAVQARQQTQDRIAPLRTQLAALGPPPAEGEPAEPPDIAAQRENINEQIASLQAQIKNAELAITRADELERTIVSAARAHTIKEILEPFPFPLAPRTIAVAAPEFFAHLGSLARAPQEWWSSLSPAQREDVVIYRIVLIAAVALAIGLALRRALLHWFGRDPAVINPSYARRLVGAVAEGMANGMIPALVFGAVLYRTLETSTIITGLFADIVVAVCVVAIFLVVSRALVRAGLAPDLPAWRLEGIAPNNARQISRLAIALAAVFAIDLFLMNATNSLPISQELESLYGLVSNAIEAALVIALMRGRLWHIEPMEEPAGDEAEAAEQARRSRFWPALRIVIVIIAGGSVVAALVGYTALSGYLINNLVISGVAVSVLYLMRGLLRELIGMALRTRFAQINLAVRHRSRTIIKFWLRAFLDLLVFAIGLVLLPPLWGMPIADVIGLVRRTMEGVTIGNVTISFADLIAALLVFVAVLVLTRIIQRALAERVLPQTTLDSGVRHSISAGFGYVGLAVAAALGVSTLGLDLSNLALIAGALSVGIGFGLQTVVNNFVSGLILLIERPVKVGDWIIVAGHEGFVKRINVRATEVETFQRASVIIPNSELISSAVVNLTHKNTLGRVEVPVGVAYGSDVELVMKILEDCLHANRSVAAWPEPYVLFRGFGDSSLDFEARGYLADIGNIITAGTELRLAIVKAFKEHDIEIPFPQRDLHLKDIDRLSAALGRGERKPPAGESETAPRPPAEGLVVRSAQRPTATGEAEGGGGER